MKANAISRIIIWSLVIVLLISLMGVGLDHRGWGPTEDIPQETLVMAKTEAPTMTKEDTSTSLQETTVAATAVNVRSAPNSDSSAVGMLEQNDTVTISRQELVNGESWAYITTPLAGWVKAEYLSMQAPSPVLSNGEITLDAKQVREIDIEWAAGNIIIEPAEVDSIQISESAAEKARDTMVWKHTNNKLVIRYSETIDRLGTILNDVASKDLTILVPMGWACDSLEIDAAFATVDVKNLVINEVDFDGASGTCNFVNCAIDELDLDTASGDIYFTGSLETLDCDAASASVFAVFDNVPSRIDMDSMSGDLDITLPSHAGFTVDTQAMSSNFVCEFGYAQNREGYYRGDGKCKITMDAMSGDLYIREYKESNAAPAVHHHTDTCTTNPESCPDNTAHHTEPHHD